MHRVNVVNHVRWFGYRDAILARYQLGLEVDLNWIMVNSGLIMYSMAHCYGEHANAWPAARISGKICKCGARAQKHKGGACRVSSATFRPCAFEALSFSRIAILVAAGMLIISRHTKDPGCFLLWYLTSSQPTMRFMPKAVEF